MKPTAIIQSCMVGPQFLDANCLKCESELGYAQLRAASHGAKNLDGVNQTITAGEERGQATVLSRPVQTKKITLLAYAAWLVRWFETVRRTMPLAFAHA